VLIWDDERLKRWKMPGLEDHQDEESDPASLSLPAHHETYMKFDLIISHSVQRAMKTIR